MSPIRDFSCKKCGTTAERMFHQEPQARCYDCGRRMKLLPLAAPIETQRRKPVFPFTTTHIDARGRPMVIESMSQLRRVEHQYGVVLSAFTSDPCRQAEPADPNLPRYRGEDILRGHRE